MFGVGNEDVCRIELNGGTYMDVRRKSRCMDVTATYLFGLTTYFVCTTLDTFTKASWCEQECQFTAPSGLGPKPDFTIYDAHSQSCALIEIKHKNARNNANSVA